MEGCIGCLLSAPPSLKNSYFVSCIGPHYLQDLHFRNQEVKDKISTFFYFPSINFLKVGGGLGPIRVNNLPYISVLLPKLDGEFDLLFGDWYNSSYKVADSYFTIYPLILLFNC